MLSLTLSALSISIHHFFFFFNLWVAVSVALRVFTTHCPLFALNVHAVFYCHVAASFVLREIAEGSFHLTRFAMLHLTRHHLRSSEREVVHTLWSKHVHEDTRTHAQVFTPFKNNLTDLGETDGIWIKAHTPTLHSCMVAQGYHWHTHTQGPQSARDHLAVAQIPSTRIVGILNHWRMHTHTLTQAVRCCLYLAGFMGMWFRLLSSPLPCSLSQTSIGVLQCCMLQCSFSGLPMFTGSRIGGSSDSRQKVLLIQVNKWFSARVFFRSCLWHL